MGKGENPNSKKNLKRFGCERDAREAGAKGRQTRDANYEFKASFRACGKKYLTDDKLKEMYDAMFKRAKAGNIQAFKTLFDVMGEGQVKEETTSEESYGVVLADVLPQNDTPSGDADG